MEDFKTIILVTMMQANFDVSQAVSSLRSRALDAIPRFTIKDYR